MCFIVIPFFYTGSQFSFHPLYASTVSGTGAPQRLLLRHRRCSAAALRPSVDSGKPESFKQNRPSALAVAGGFRGYLVGVSGGGGVGRRAQVHETL